MSLTSKVKTGGLMRCCIETLAEYEGEEKENQVLDCHHCEDSIIFIDGWWQWNRNFVKNIEGENNA